MQVAPLTELSPPPSPIERRRRRLASVCNVRLALADCLRALEAGTLESSKARVLIYGYSVLVGIIQGTDIERRLMQLESSMKGAIDEGA